MATVLIEPQRPIATPPPAAATPDPEWTFYELSVDQYHRMAELGILPDGAPVELLEGLLVRKMTKNPPHVLSAKVTADALRRLTPVGYHVAMENPFTTTTSEPEPDVAAVRGSARDYAGRHPVPGEMALIVEVADSSAARDRGVKRRVYARAGVPVYWIVLVQERFVEVYTQPAGSADAATYGELRRFAEGESVPVVIDGQTVGAVAVADLLP